MIHEFGEEKLVPPQNFALVEHGIYRSAYPSAQNLPFLQTLGLRSIVYLCPEPYEHQSFLSKNGINLFGFPIGSKKDSTMPEDVICEALKVLLDARNYPLLIHCNGGKHRTGCLVACFRKVQNWALSCALQEYRRYSGSKARAGDELSIRLFDPNTLRNEGHVWGYENYLARDWSSGCQIFLIFTSSSLP